MILKFVLLIEVHVSEDDDEEHDDSDPENIDIRNDSPKNFVITCCNILLEG